MLVFHVVNILVTASTGQAVLVATIVWYSIQESLLHTKYNRDVKRQKVSVCALVLQVYVFTYCVGLPFTHISLDICICVYAMGLFLDINISLPVIFIYVLVSAYATGVL